MNDSPELPGTEDLRPDPPKQSKTLPALSLVRAEAALLGLPESDADWIYEGWAAFGFRTRRGPIKDWRLAMRVWYRSGWFPSQKKNGYQRPSQQQEALELFRRIKNGR